MGEEVDLLVQFLPEEILVEQLLVVLHLKNKEKKLNLKKKRKKRKKKMLIWEVCLIEKFGLKKYIFLYFCCYIYLQCFESLCIFLNNIEEECTNFSKVSCKL